MSEHLSTLRLHQLRYEELTGDAKTQAEAHLASCELCRERLDAQLRERVEFEARSLPPALREAFAAPPQSTPAPANDNRAWLRQLSWLAAVAAVLLAVVTVQPWQMGAEQPVTSGVRTKGASEADHLRAFVQTSTGAELLASGAAVHPGDSIQLELRRAPRPWATVAGVDARGDAAVYSSWRVVGDEWQAAPFALTLDEVLGTEQIFVLFTDEEPNRAALRAQLQRGDLPPDVRVERLAFEKVP